MITIQPYPKTRGGRPDAWYAADWLRNEAFVYRTKALAVSKARELDSADVGHIVNVDWLDLTPRHRSEKIGRHKFKITEYIPSPQELIGASFKIFDCRDLTN